MGYQITLTNGNLLTTVPDSQLVTTYAGLTLIGKNYAGFGTSFNDNLVHLTENFASSTPPVNPLIGQLWFDTVGGEINFWNGTQFKAISVITNSDTAPLSPQEGDEWFNTTTQQLFIWNGTEWLLIGPPSPLGGKEGFVVAQTNGVYYLQLYANNEIIAIVSSVAMTNPGIPGVGNVRPGFNFITNPESTPPITPAGIFNINDLTIGNGDQIEISPDVNNNGQFIVNGNLAFIATSDPYGTANAIPAAQELASGNIKGVLFANVISANSFVGLPSFVVPGLNGQLLFSTGAGANGWSTSTALTFGANGLIANAVTSNSNITAKDSINVVNSIVAANVLAGSGGVTSEGNVLVGGDEQVDGSLTVFGAVNLGGPVTINYNTSGDFELPTDQGLSGQILTSDGAGGTNWANAASGNISAVQTAGMAGTSRNFYGNDSVLTVAPASPDLYQNTSGSVKVVTVSGDNGGGGGRAAFWCGPTALSMVTVGFFGRVNDGSGPPNFYPSACTIIVPPGYFYGVTATTSGGSGAFTCQQWTEWTLTA